MSESCVVKGHPHPGRCMSQAEYRVIPQDELMEWAATVPPGCYATCPARLYAHTAHLGDRTFICALPANVSHDEHRDPVHGTWRDLPISKPGPTVQITGEMLTVDHLLTTPSRFAKMLQNFTIERFITDNIFGPPWLHADTWCGWPREFVFFPRLADLTARFKLGRQTITYRAQHALSALRGDTDQCPREEW